jgi:hypothetical protein
VTYELFFNALLYSSSVVQSLSADIAMPGKRAGELAAAAP